MKRTERGIIYFASGKDYIKEANHSAKSVRLKLKDIPIAIFTDGKGKEFIDKNLFDKIITNISVDQNKIGKIESIINSPFEKTLFLDTDTEILEPVYELFELLDKFDLAVAHAPRRTKKLSITIGLECFPECNSGVIVYNKNKKTSDFFRSWIEIYNEFTEEGFTWEEDQPSFQKALFNSSLRFYVLPPEYNIRTVFPYFAGNMKVKIIHGRGKSFPRARNNVNSKLTLRIANHNRSYLGNLFFEIINKFI